MTTRIRIESTIATIIITVMLVWGFSCEPGTCITQLPEWLMTWWSLSGLAIIYLIWRLR